MKSSKFWAKRVRFLIINNLFQSIMACGIYINNILLRDKLYIANIVNALICACSFALTIKAISVDKLERRKYILYATFITQIYFFLSLC